MFLAHFTGGGIESVRNMYTRDISFWYNEAMKLHKEMNEVKE